jgi:hypothetical protein
VSLIVACARCRKVLDKPGGVILGVPRSVGPGEDVVRKWHVCAGCMPAVEAFIDEGRTTDVGS